MPLPPPPTALHFVQASRLPFPPLSPVPPLSSPDLPLDLESHYSFYYNCITPTTTSTQEDTDMPDDTPTEATAAPTPDDTAGCYINTQRDAEKSIVKRFATLFILFLLSVMILLAI